MACTNPSSRRIQTQATRNDANFGGRLSGTLYSVRRLGCSLRAYASAESEVSRRGLIEEARYQNREIEALLPQMARLRNCYETIRWPYSTLNRTTAAAVNNGRVDMWKLHYLYHEPLLLKWIFQSLGQDRTEAWWETWKAKNATQEVADRGLSTCEAEPILDNSIRLRADQTTDNHYSSKRRHWGWMSTVFRSHNPWLRLRRVTLVGACSERWKTFRAWWIVCRRSR